MAAQSGIILPEVHLNSPIVTNKLLYLINLGDLPIPSDDAILSTLPQISWETIRQEETNLAARLHTIKDQIYSRILTKYIKSSKDRPRIILWPSCISMLHTVTIPDFTGRVQDALKLIHASASLGNKPIDNLLSSISEKLTSQPTLFHSQRNATYTNHPPIDCPSLAEICLTFEGSRWSDNFHAWFLIRHQMRLLISRLQSDQFDNLVTCLDSRDQVVLITPELVVCFTKESQCITYLTFEMVLMVCDMYEGRLNAIALCKLSNYLSPLLPRLTNLLHIVDHLALTLGNDVYPIVASLESLVYAKLQMYDPVEDVRGEFFEFICGEIDNQLKICPHWNEQQRLSLILKLTSQYAELSPDLIAELLCIMRLWGHPMLTSQAAAAKVRESMCAPKIIDLETNLKTLAFFHGIIINGFRRKHDGIWPHCILPPMASQSLREHYNDNSELSYHYVLQHWKEIAYIEFQKSFDADPGEDLSIFMKDKAISCEKQDWLSVFRKSLAKPIFSKFKAPIPRSANRRLLLNFLTDTHFDPNKELEYVTTGAYLDDETFCASYSLKEKEIKPTGRIFAKLTKKMRSCQVIAESLLAAHAGKLFRENGVVQDQLSLTKSLLTMSQIGLISSRSRRSVRDNVTLISHIPSSPVKHNIHSGIGNAMQDSSHHPAYELAACFLTTDLSKYCLNWRYQSIIMFATSLNKLYGYPHLFEWIHLRLMRSTLYVGDPFNPPLNLQSISLDELDNSDIFIVSPRGGIEGLCQKMWTMISIAVILLSATESDTRVMSMVQGDNQAMAITTKVASSLTHVQKKQAAYRVSKLFFERLKANNFGMGHHLKEQETLISSDFFIYSKRIFWRGRILNQALKNATKLCLISDVLGDCSQASVSNLSTTIMRLTENGVEKDLAYKLNHYYTIRQLVFDLHFPITKEFEDEVTTQYLSHPQLISRLSFLPSQLGGLNYYSCSRLFNRNVGDPLVSALSDVKRLISCNGLPHWILNNILSRPPGEGTWSTLAADPYALNIPYLNPPTTFLKKHAQSALMETSTNPMLRGIFSENSKEEENDLARFLLDRSIVMPRAAHIIIEQTSCGRRKQIQGYLDSTRTIIKHALSIKPLSFRKLCLVSDYNILYFEFNLSLIKEPSGAIKTEALLGTFTCSIDLARHLRKLSWANILNGRPLDGLETPDPLELISGTLTTCGEQCKLCQSGDSKYTWLFLPEGIRLDSDPSLNPPIRVPYIGSQTDERRVASMAYIKGASACLRSALRLAGIYIWAFGDTDKNWDEAHQLCSTRIAINQDQLRMLTPLPTSSNISHRLDDGMTQIKFTPASSYSFSSYAHISNDLQNLEIEAGQVDSNLIYQQIMLLGLGILETFLTAPETKTMCDIVIHLHTEGSCCTRPVNPCLLNESHLIEPSLTVPYSNKFVYDAAPLPDSELIKLDELAYQATISAIDLIPDFDRIPLLAHFVGIQVAHAISGLDSTTSLINDAVVESDYASNWITEFMNTYLDKIFYYCAWNLLCELAYQLYYLRVKGLHGITDYLHLTLERIPGLALSGLAATISHPRILRRAINLGIITPSNAPYLATLNYHKLACEAIEWGATQVLRHLLDGYDIEIIIPSEFSTELSDRVLNLVARKLSLLSILHCSAEALPHVRGKKPIDKCHILTQCILLYIDNTGLPLEVIQRLKKTINEPKITAFPCNLYYLTRKVLNWIKDSDQAQYVLSDYYDLIGYTETIQPTLRTTVDLSSQACTLTKFDKVEILFDGGTLVERFALPETGFSDDLCPPIVVDPPNHHILRPLGLSSTSWYKGLSLVHWLNQTRVPDGNHLYLAEGSGALMSCLEYFCPGKTIYYNSLFSSGQNPPQRNYTPLPTQFIESVPYKQLINDIPCSGGWIQVFEPLWSGDGKQTDLSETDCINFILGKIENLSCSLVSIDLEDTYARCSTIISPALIHSILIAHMVLKIDGILILKSYLEPFRKFSQLITILWGKFGQVTIIRSSYSDPKKTEIFLIARNKETASLHSFNQTIQYARKLDEHGMTLLSDQDIGRLLSALKSNQQSVTEEIIKVLRTGSLSDVIDDSLSISQIGIGPQALTILNFVASKSFDQLNHRVSAILSTMIKEVIDTMKGDLEETQRILFNSYNLTTTGKINTNISTVCFMILDILIRNWHLVPPYIQKRLILDLEIGLFKIVSYMNLDLFLSYCQTKKYFIETLPQRYLNNLFEYGLIVQLERPVQKRYWRYLSYMLFLGTIDEENAELDDDEFVPPVFDEVEEERDLQGNVI